MSTQPLALRRPGAATNLSIRPPSPNHLPPPTIVTPTNPNSNQRPHAISPTHSTRSGFNTNGQSRGSFDTSKNEGPPVPAKGFDKKLPLPPWASPGKRTESRGSYAGAYDNKLVSSTVSHLPPIPPLSPTPTGNSSTVSSQIFPHTRSYDLNHLHPHTSTIKRPPSIPSVTSSLSGQSAGGVLVLPDGTVLSSAGTGSTGTGENRTVAETMAHSSAGSPWNVLLMHVLPIFGGGEVKTSIEELNGLCLTHIVASSGRVPTSRLVAVLSSDLREFIGSGMLTFKHKFDNYDEVKLVAKAAEQWVFFWSKILPSLEAILLPFSQIKDQLHTTTLSPIKIRHLLLTGFLTNMLQPILSRLIEIIALAPSTSPITSLHPSQMPPPTQDDLSRILQMSLVLATQAKPSTFYPFRSIDENREYDKQCRENVEALGKAVRWRMNAIKRKEEENTENNSQSQYSVAVDEYGIPKDGNVAAPKRHSLHRGPSLSQSGRFRRRGWRASTNMSQVYGDDPTPLGMASRQNSEFGYLNNAQTQEWASSVREEDEDEDTTPGQSFAPIPAPAGSVMGIGQGGRGDASYATTAFTETPATYSGGMSAMTASTMRGNSHLVGMGGGWEYDQDRDQQTPQAEYRRGMRETSADSSELTPTAAAPIPEIRRRDTGRL